MCEHCYLHVPADSCTCRIPKELLDRYDEEVRAVSRRLQPVRLPSYCMPLANGHRASPATSEARPDADGGKPIRAPPPLPHAGQTSAQNILAYCT